MIRLVVASAFRDAPRHQVRAWVDRIDVLRDYLARHTPGVAVAAIAAEGDSRDTSCRDHLVSACRELAVPLEVVECSHGGPRFGSVVDERRMRDLSVVGNSIFSAVGPKDDLLLYVESDLIWHARVVAALMARLERPWVDIVAPMIFAGSHFYDVWAYRGMDGHQFSPFEPYHSSLAATSDNLVQVSSAGSFLLMRGPVARAVRITDGNALVGWCAEARRKGFSIFVDRSERVEHPA